MAEVKKNVWSRPFLKFKFIGLALFFGISYTQKPIYNSSGNQNTKFLHGLAEAGHGFLQQDWMANTIDPLPVFSYLVKIFYGIHPEYSFYLCYFALFGLYAWSMLGIASSAFPLRKEPMKMWLFLALFVAIHTIHINIFGFDTGTSLHEGVAQQSILMSVFQPACFGVFLIASIYLFLASRKSLSIVCLGIAVSCHPTYLPSAIALTLAYACLLFQEKGSLIPPIKMSLFAAVLTLPSCLYLHLFVTSPTNPKLGDRALDIIVNERIPHHSNPAIWGQDSAVIVQILLVILALVITQKKRKLWTILLISFLFATLLTFLVILTDNRFLALINPWRISVYLVPLSSCLIVAQISDTVVDYCGHHQPSKTHWIRYFSLTVLSAIFIYNAISQINIFREYDEATPAMNFAKSIRSSEQLYLVDPLETRLRKFRLYTGIPILINNKTHPYKDVEVIEWHSRLALAANFYGQTSDRCSAFAQITSQYPISHVLWPHEKTLDCPGFKLLFQDDAYRIYGTNPSPN